MPRSLLAIGILFISTFAQLGQADESALRNVFSKAIKTPQDQQLLTRLEQSLPAFLELDVRSNENVDKVFSKFKEAIRLFPANIQRDTPLNENTARALFPAIQPIYRYVKESVRKSILKLIDLPRQLVHIPARNLPDANLNSLLANSDDDTVANVLDLNANRQDFSDEQKTILVQNYISRIKSKLTPSNFQQLITAKLGASFLGNLPSDFLAKDPIFDDGSVIRNVATWLRFLSPLQRDAISSKMYHALTDTTGKMAAGNAPTRLTSEDANTLDMIARTMPSLSTRQIINAVGDRIVPLLGQSSTHDYQSCTTALALLNRTIESKKTSNRYFRPDLQMVQRWQECYSGCDLNNLFSNRQELKELLKSHPDPQNCEGLVQEVKKEYNLERDISAPKLREVADAFGSIYRADEISNLSEELMAELGRDEKTLEKLGAQDLSPSENLWGKNMLAKLGNLIPGLDNAILKQILTRGRGELPILFTNSSSSSSSSSSFIRKLVPSKIRLLIDQYATEPNLAKYQQLLASDYAKKYIRSETLMRILHLTPDVLRLVRFTPAQASAAITSRLGQDKSFDGSLNSLGSITNFINGLTKTDVERIKPEESLQAVQQAFGGAKNKNIDNQMQSNTRYAFGNVLRRGLQTSEATQKADEYIKGLFREDNLVDDLNPQLFTTLTNVELDAVNRLDKDQANRFWNAVGSIREPACCSIVNENRFRLADYALRHYGSATGDLDVFKLSQLGPFLTTSLRASDIRRMTTDALINKIAFFKSNCFQPAKAEAQALGARLNDALGEVDDSLKTLYLDLIGELAGYLPADITASKRVLAERASYLSRSLDKLQNRNEKCQVPDTDAFFSKATQGIKRTLANAFLDQRSSFHHLRERRQANQKRNNITCLELRHMGSSISALSSEQISSIANDVVFQCIGTFGAVNDYSADSVKQIAQKYIQALESQGRHIQSLAQAELFELNSILTGFTPDELLQLRTEYFRDGNFLAFIGNLGGWTTAQLKSFARLALSFEQRLTPVILENSGQILCAIDEQFLRRIPPEEVKSYLSILANIECPNDGDGNYSSTLFDMLKTIHQGDLLRPHIFGSLGTIAAGLKSADLSALSPELLNFFPQQALARLPRDVFKSLSNEQLQNLNIEQIKTIPSSLLSSLNGKQMAVVNQILYPFKTSGAITRHSLSMLTVWLLPLAAVLFVQRSNSV